MKAKTEYIYIIRQSLGNKKQPVDQTQRKWWDMSCPHKIGWSVSPRQRLEKFQTGNPNHLSLIGQWEGRESDETEIKDLLKSRKIRNEWFMLCPQEADMLEMYCQVRELRSQCWMTWCKDNESLEDYLFLDSAASKYESWFNSHDPDCQKCYPTPVGVPKGLSYMYSQMRGEN